MSKTSVLQRLEALKGWQQQLERNTRGYRRPKKTVQRDDDDIVIPYPVED
jgi:hypothetical protein